MKETIKTPTTFDDLVKAYNADPDNAQALTDLATATAYSVLRKVIDPTRKTAPTSGRPSDSGINPALVALRNDLTRDIADLTRLSWTTDNATRLVWTDDGDLTQETIDPALSRAAADLAGQALGDGLDLVHDAVCAIMEQTAAQMVRDPGMPTDLERPYETRRLKHKVYIRTADSAGGWETVATTPIQEVYRAVRRSIRSSRAMQTDPRNGYSYIEDIATDPETGDSATIYRRLTKYADLGGDGTAATPADHIPGQPAGLDGKPTNYSADRATVETTDLLVARLNLSDREATVLQYRLAGYGESAISTAMGISKGNYYNLVKRIRDKARKIGLDPDKK